MRIGIVPERLSEWVALRLNRVPTPLADGVFAMMACRAVMAGVRLGLFACLSKAPRTAIELATDLAADPPMIEALAKVLVTSGYLRHTERGIALTEPARRWLDPRSSTYLGDFIAFNYDHWDWWSHLEEAIATGQPIAIHQTTSDSAAWRRYVLAMGSLARLAAGDVVRAIPVKAAPHRLIDVGGSHGVYAAEFCRQYSKLQATVVDLRPVIEVSAKIARTQGVSESVHFQAADVLYDDLGDSYDVALVFQILHHLGSVDTSRLLDRVRATMSTGGTIAILEPARDGPSSQLGALLQLHFLLTSKGGLQTASELRQLLSDHGCHTVRSHWLPTVPGLVLTTGIV